jgi:superfamily II DNA or RNA helicase
MILRPYQTEALDGIRQAFGGSAKSALLVMATGLGKTITFAALAKEVMPLGKILVLAHREELIFQAANKIKEVTGAIVGVEMGDDHVTTIRSHQPDIIVSTIQTQIAGMAGAGRMTKFHPDDFVLVVIDEAHHAAAETYKRVIDYYRANPSVLILGVTATPDRADEMALGQIFDTVAFEYDILNGVQDGWLVPISQSAVTVDGLDYSSVRTTAGELNGADLSAVLEQEKILHSIAGPAIELAASKRTLVFTASVHQAERLAEILSRHKPGSAQYVYAGTPSDERRKLFRDYADGKFQFLCNCGIATEGFDDPGIGCIVLARPTKSRSLYAQMCGRGTRPLPGVVDPYRDADPTVRIEAIKASAKPCIEIVDFVGNSGRHKLITAADILGGEYPDEVVERAKRSIEAKSGLPTDVATELELAERAIEAERRRLAERAQRARITASAHYSTRKIDPFNVLSIAPHREKGWNVGRKPTEKQAEFLEKWGVDPKDMTFTQASQVITTLIQRRMKGLCTYKQAKVLRKNGIDPENMTFDQASKEITLLARNWKRKDANNDTGRPTVGTGVTEEPLPHMWQG